MAIKFFFVVLRHPFAEDASRRPMIDRARQSQVKSCELTHPALLADAAGNRVLLINGLSFDQPFNAELDAILDLGEQVDRVADIFGVVTGSHEAMHIAFWNPDGTPRIGLRQRYSQRSVPV